MIDKSGLHNFLGKLNNISQNPIEDVVADDVSQRISDYTQEAYPFANVTKQKIGKGQAIVIAQHEYISFLEFGTGVAGEGKYKGNLPTERIDFMDRHGRYDYTEGWEYNYYAKHIRNKNPNSRVKDWAGFAPKAGMLNAELKTINEITRKK